MKSALLFLALLTSLVASEHPADQIAVSLPDEVTMPRGRSAEFYISLTVPKKHHIYLKHANKNGRAILTTFSAAAESGFQLTETKRPQGIKLGDEFVLRDKGMFLFELSELAMNDDGAALRVPVRIRVQICGEGESAICYMPKTVEKTVAVRIAGPSVRTRDLPDATLPWVTTYDAAIGAAKIKGQNIFALISDPSYCGACAFLESKVLSDASVNKMLKNRFVVYRVPEKEYHKAEIKGSFGIPYYFIISPEGKNLQKWMGAPGAPQFAQRLEPYAKDAAAPVAPNTSTDAIPLASCKIPLKQSFAYQATQKGDFKSSGNMRFVLNNSSPGMYTVLALDRTGEIEGSYNGRLASGKLVVERYLGGRDLQFECSTYGVTGNLPEQSLQLSIELR